MLTDIVFILYCGLYRQRNYWVADCQKSMQMMSFEVAYTHVWNSDILGRPQDVTKVLIICRFNDEILGYHFLAPADHKTS